MAFGFALLAASLSVGGCTYSPHPTNGKLVCGPGGACPSGYSCRLPEGACFLNGTGPNPDGGGQPDVVGANDMQPKSDKAPSEGGIVFPGSDVADRDRPLDTIATADGAKPDGATTNPDVVVRPAVQRYIGTWTMAADATITTECTGSTTPDVTSITGDTVDLNADSTGSGHDIEALYICAIFLDVGTAGAQLNDPYPYCPPLTDKSGDPTYTWFPESFEVLTTDGATATHVSTYDVTANYADGTTVNCTQTVQGHMTK